VLALGFVPVGLSAVPPLGVACELGARAAGPSACRSCRRSVRRPSRALALGFVPVGLSAGPLLGAACEPGLGFGPVGLAVQPPSAACEPAGLRTSYGSGLRRLPQGEGFVW
jgi:hypothetical protein